MAIISEIKFSDCGTEFKRVNQGSYKTFLTATSLSASAALTVASAETV